ncbi:MAG TPA: imidazole glycerol phosphate synthase subunit HisH [Desulfobacteria bacterium]|nr:imidazole glycerol phosphate synthase subunit HisH [Desulfobacteria bacterium]
MIAIIDYGRGNLRSVQKGLERFGYEAVITSDPVDLAQADGLILPGVGAFADAMQQLKNLGLVEPIKQEIAAGKPFLGICLGMQVLFEVGEEYGIHEGLGVLPGRVVKFPPGRKVPHMGWNQLHIKQTSPLLAGFPDGGACYFVHSFYVAPDAEDVVLATSDYGFEFAAVVNRENVYGVQFHPEKSSDLGLKILNNFGGMVAK